MRGILRELMGAVKDLFPQRRKRAAILGLVALASSVSIGELLSAHFFATLILPDAPNRGDIVAPAAAFLVMLALLRMISYSEIRYRITVFEQNLGGVSVDKSRESWRWAAAMETVSLLAMLTRLLVMSLGVFFFSPIFGMANAFVVVVVFSVFSMKINGQYVEQREFRGRQWTAEAPAVAERVRSRIMAGEAASLLGSSMVLALAGFLVLLYVLEQLAASQTLVLFLALRMIGGLYSSISSGLMRLVRARVYSETSATAPR